VLNPISQEFGANPSVLPDPLAFMALPDEADYESWETPEGYPIAVDEFFKAKWGGSPGWERHPSPPLKLIGELTEGLVPI
jgi:hypothetical protein